MTRVASPTLSEYIDEIGMECFAKRFRWTLRRVKAYRYGERIPRGKDAKKIVERTPVTYEGIYGAKARERTPA
jgi:hypothetical protein